MIEESVPAAELAPGDRVLIRPGESVPADGIVLEGRSNVDESLLTGESLPVAKTPGQPLVGGSINVESPLVARVEKTGPDTALSAILRLLDRASAEKPRLSTLADRVAAWFVAGVLLLAAAVAYIWWRMDPALALPVTIAVLVITCPCALSIATPTALAASTGALTRRGLLVTRAHALETLARATHFVFDKTGTLTLGQLRLARLDTLSRHSAEECVRLAASLERYSEHPVARALIAAAGGAALDDPAEVVNVPGAGLAGRLGEREYSIGTPEFVRARTGLAPPEAVLERLRREGGTVVLLAQPGALLAAFVFADEPRPDAAALVAELERRGKTVWLLTGDHEQAARRVAAALGIEHVAAGLKPADKLAHIERLRERGAVVAMVGDGVNDAPVLAGAEVSVAVASAAHVAAAASDVILLSPRLEHLAEGVRTARRALGVIRQNLFWAVAYNLLAVPAAALGYINPLLAALGMSGSSLLVVANALRLVRRRESGRT
jgi:Cu2+-exporting ATPase